MGHMNLPWYIALICNINDKIYTIKTGFARLGGKVGNLLIKTGNKLTKESNHSKGH